MIGHDQPTKPAPPAGLFDTPWARVLVCSLLQGLAHAAPTVTVKALILAHYGPHVAFRVNGLLDGSKALMAFAFAPLVGRLSDASGRRVPLVLCVLFSTFPSFIMLIGAIIKPSLSSRTWTVWAVFYILCGAAKSTDALCTAYIVDSVPQRHRSGALGINLAVAFGLSSALGNLGGTAVYRTWGTVPTFALPVLLALGNAAYVLGCLPESLPPARRRALSECADCAALHPAAAFRLLGLDASGVLWRLCAGTFCVYLSFFGFITNYQLFLQTAFGFSGGDCAIFVSIFGVVSFCTKCSIGALRHCLSEPARADALVHLGFGAFLLASLLMAAAPSGALFLCGAMLMALGLIAPPVLAAIASATELDLPARESGTVQALLVAFGALAEGVSPLFFGLLLDASAGSPGPGVPFASGAATAVVGWWCSYWAVRRTGMYTGWRSNLAKPLIFPVGLATPTGLR